MMKIVVLFLLSLSCFAAYAENNEQTQFEQQANMAIKEFAQTLKQALVTSMKNEGPVIAIAVCKDVAPTIAQQLSSKYQLTIARTSLKVRNPSNQPDDWELANLKRLEVRHSSGEPINKLSFTEHVATTAGKQWRMLKAIPTGQLCLTCHGKKIAAPIQAQLNQLYPNDQATGFRLGDIRGAFTVRSEL